MYRNCLPEHDCDDFDDDDDEESDLEGRLEAALDNAYFDDY